MFCKQKFRSAHCSWAELRTTGWKRKVSSSRRKIVSTKCTDQKLRTISTKKQGVYQVRHTFYQVLIKEKISIDPDKRYLWLLN